MTSFSDKLYNLESAPPEGVWEKVAAELDQSASGYSFPATLANLEVTPPALAWDNIVSSLDETETKVIPINRSKKRFVRYAAAAMLIGIVGWGITRFASADNEGDITPVTAKISTPTPGNSDSNNSKQIPTTIIDADEQALQDSKQTLASLDIPGTGAKSKVPRISTSNRGLRGQVTVGEFSNVLYTYDDHVPNLSERYVTVMTPDGGFIRMARKWSNLLCCVSGEDQDADCKDQLKKWQEKIATTPATPGNFMDLLDLVNTLNQDTQL